MIKRNDQVTKLRHRIYCKIKFYKNEKYIIKATITLVKFWPHTSRMHSSEDSLNDIVNYSWVNLSTHRDRSSFVYIINRGRGKWVSDLKNRASCLWRQEIVCSVVFSTLLWQKRTIGIFIKFWYYLQLFRKSSCYIFFWHLC